MQTTQNGKLVQLKGSQQTQGDTKTRKNYNLRECCLTENQQGSNRNWAVSEIVTYAWSTGGAANRYLKPLRPPRLPFETTPPNSQTNVIHNTTSMQNSHSAISHKVASLQAKQASTTKRKRRERRMTGKHCLCHCQHDLCPPASPTESYRIIGQHHSQ